MLNFTPLLFPERKNLEMQNDSQDAFVSHRCQTSSNIIEGFDQKMDENSTTANLARPNKDELYRTLARNFPNGAVLFFDQDLRYVLADGAGLSEVGLSREMLEGKTIWEVFPLEVCQAIEPYYRAALAGKSSDFDVPYAGRLFHVYTLPIWNDTGEICTGMVMTQDITERKQVEESLIQSHQRYEQLVNTIDGIVWEGDAQTFEYFFVSQQAERLLGYPVERWTSEPTFWSDHIHPEDRERAINYCTISTANKQDHVFEYRMIAADGRVIWLRDIVTVLVEKDQPVKLRGIMVDITENKKVEAELSEREQQYQSIFESVSDGLFINRLEDGHLIDFNPAAARMHGYTDEEFRKLHPDDFIHPDSHHIFHEYLDKVRAGSVFHSRARDVRKDGSAFYVEVMGTPFIYKGEPHTLAVVHDIDEEVKSYQLLEQRVAERTRELQTLLDVSRNVASTLDLDQLLSLTIEQIRTIVDFTALRVWMLEEEDTFVVSDYQGFFLGEQNLKRWKQPAHHQAILNVIKQQEPVIIPDVRDDSPLASVWREATFELLGEIPGLVSCWMGVPLLVNNRVIGLLSFNHEQPNYYTDHHAKLALALANHAAIAIENARLFQTVQRGAEQFRAISELGQNITSILDVDRLLTQTVNLIQKAFGYYHVHIGLIEDDIIVFPATAGVFASEPVCTGCSTLRLKVGQEGICGLVAGKGVPLAIPDVSKDPRYLHPKGATGSGAVVPLIVKGRVIGILDVESRQLNAFDERDVAVLQLLANQVAIAIENARLYKNTQELAALQERQKLARELHDSVSQALYGIGLGARAARKLVELESTQREDLVQPLDYVLSLAEAGLAEMRALIFELRPDSLENEGLVAALNKQAAALEARHPIAVDASFDQEPELSLDTKQTLYRIAQEAMNNIVKHARANRVGLCLKKDSKQVSLEIQDDGIGFDPRGDFPGHLGLQSMRERAERLGGKVTIESMPGEGTRVLAQIPVRS